MYTKHTFLTLIVQHGKTLVKDGLGLQNHKMCTKNTILTLIVVKKFTNLEHTLGLHYIDLDTKRICWVIIKESWRLDWEGLTFSNWSESWLTLRGHSICQNQQWGSKLHLTLTRPPAACGQCMCMTFSRVQNPDVTRLDGNKRKKCSPSMWIWAVNSSSSDRLAATRDIHADENLIRFNNMCAWCKLDSANWYFCSGLSRLPERSGGQIG